MFDEWHDDNGEVRSPEAMREVMHAEEPPLPARKRDAFHKHLRGTLMVRGKPVTDAFPEPPPLTKNERAFIRFYKRFRREPDGVKQAALACGAPPQVAEVWGEELLKRPSIIAALGRAKVGLPSEDEVEALVKEKKERQRFYATVALDESQKTEHRLKAVELLGRSEGDFVDRIEHTSKSLEELVLAAHKKPQMIEADIEDAEYEEME